MFLRITLFCVVFFGGFLAIVIVVKLRQVRAAARWPSVMGEVISAQASAGSTTVRHATEVGEADVTEVRNYARVTYRYSVAGRRYTGKRISIGEDLGDDDVAGKLQRYPKGRMVEVFYDPANPETAVLERALPQGCARAGLMGLGLVAVAVAVFGFGLDYAVEAVGERIETRSNASSVVFAATFSVLATWFAIVMWRQGRAGGRGRGRGRGRELALPVLAAVFTAGLAWLLATQ